MLKIGWIPSARLLADGCPRDPCVWLDPRPKAVGLRRHLPKTLGCKPQSAAVRAAHAKMSPMEIDVLTASVELEAPTGPSDDSSEIIKSPQDKKAYRCVIPILSCVLSLLWLQLSSIATDCSSR